MINQTDFVNRWLVHIKILADEIGPRASTTESERRGSEYCQDVLVRLGLQPEMEPFNSARSIFDPHLYASLAMLFAFAVYPLGGTLSAGIAALISLVAFVSELLELGFRDNLLRRLVPKGSSQNVVATVDPAAEHHQDMILIGHVDSQVTPIIFSSRRWLSVYQNFTTIAFILFSTQVLLYIAGTFTQWNWIWLASIPSAVCAILLAALCIHANRTPVTAGANDNASGAGLVLALAEQLQVKPLQHTRVWLVCTGCEEVQHYGAIDFFNRHQVDFLKPVTIVFETLGCADPAWLVKEGIVIPFYPDSKLVRLAERLSAENPEWGAHPAQISGGNTEMADAVRVGIPAITLMGITPQGEVPYWHQLEDTSDKMDPAVMSHAYAFVWEYLKAIDKGEARSI